MTKSIKELELELIEAKRKIAQEGKDALAAVPLTYIWEVKWQSDFVFYCGKRLSGRSQQELSKVLAQYPMCSSMDYSDSEKWQGMKYLLIGNHLVRVGGGTLVLKGPDNSKSAFDYEPRLLSDEEASELRACRVPDSLKAR